MDKRELYKSKLEDMNKEQLINYSLDLLEEVWDLENNRDKALEYIQFNKNIYIYELIKILRGE